MKDVDGVADLRKDGKIERGGDDLLARSGGGEQLTAGTEDARRAAEHSLARRAAGAARKNWFSMARAAVSVSQ